MSSISDEQSKTSQELARILTNPDPIVLDPENVVDNQVLGYFDKVKVEVENWEIGDAAHPAMLMASVARLVPTEHHNRIFSLIEQIHRDSVDLRRSELETERFDANTRRLEVTGGYRDRNYGRGAALVFALTLVGVSTYLIMHNKDTAGLVGICATIAAIVVAMIAGNVANVKSGAAQDNEPAHDRDGEKSDDDAPK